MSECLKCQKIKVEQQKKPSGLLQPLEIPEWTTEHITMGFIVRLPQTRTDHDAIGLSLEYS